MHIFLFTLLGTCFAYLNYRSQTESSIFDVAWFLLILIAGLILFIISIVKDIAQYKNSGSIGSFTSMFVGIFFVLINIGIISYYNSQNNKESLIVAKNEDEWLYFRTDGTFQGCIGNAFYQRTVSSTYTIHDSTIEIKASSIMPARTMEIRTLYIDAKYTDDKKTQIKYFIYPTDSNGVVNIYGTYYVINEDNRKLID